MAGLFWWLIYSGLLPPVTNKGYSTKYSVTLVSVAPSTHGLQVTDVMHRWVAWDDVIYSPVVSLKVFITSDTHRFKDGLCVGSSFPPFWTVMPLGH